MFNLKKKFKNPQNTLTITQDQAYYFIFQQVARFSG